jgi:hypothetical protein
MVLIVRFFASITQHIDKKRPGSGVAAWSGVSVADAI